MPGCLMLNQTLLPQKEVEQESIAMQPVVPTGKQGLPSNPYQEALTNKQLHSPKDNLQVSEYGGFEFNEGLNLNKIEGSVWNAAWHNQALGITADMLIDGLVSSEADPEYNVLNDIPDKFLNENYLQYFINSKNSNQTAALVKSLEREESNRAIEQESPWQYFGASLALTPIDPLFWAFPGTNIATKTRIAWQAAGKSLTGKMIAKDLGAMALSMGAEGLTYQGIIELGKHQTQELATVKESVYSTLSAGLLTSVFGVGLVGGATYIQAHKQAISLLSGADPSVSYVPKNPNFKPHGYELLGNVSPAESIGAEAGNFIPGVPKFAQKWIGLSPATQLVESPSINANAFSTDMYSLPLNTSVNVTKNKATEIPMSQVIEQYRKNMNAGMLEVDKIFREQLGVESGWGQGFRARLAEKWLKNGALNRESFSIAVADVMDLGVQSPNPYVNRAAQHIQNNIINPSKQQLVDLGLMNKKFLEPEFDNYFTRMWLRDQIKQNPEDFKQIAYAWFNETNNYYRANFDQIEKLNKPVQLNRKNLDIVNRKIKKRLSSSSYQEFQESKRVAAFAYKAERDLLTNSNKEFKKSLKSIAKEIKASEASKSPKKVIDKLKKEAKELERQIKLNEKALQAKKTKAKETRSLKDEDITELKSRRDNYKKALEDAEAALYNFIPPKYLTPDGHIPSIKQAVDLRAAADQTLTRILGMDIDNVMNPILSIGSPSNPNPLQLRAFTIPSGFKTNIANPDGTLRTITMDQFRSKDIWRMVDNYSKATAAPIGLTSLAKKKGFKDISELKRWYLQNIEKDYLEMRKGKSGKESEKLINRQKKDYQNVETAFQQMYDVAGRSISIMGTGFAKFSRRAKTFNGVTQLGSAALSCIPELAMPLFRQGFLGSIGDWMPTMAKKTLSAGFLKGTSAFEDNLKLIKDLNYAINTEIGMRMKAFLNEEDLLIKRNWWAASVEPIVNMFGNITRINQITDLGEGLAGHLSIARTLRILDKKFKKGVYSERDRIRNRSVFLNESDEALIYEMWKEAGSARYQGSYASNFDQWNINTPERARAADSFKASIVKDINKSAQKASKADMGTIADSDVGSFIFQFKDWMLAANNNLLYSGIQKIGQKEYDVLLSLGAMIGMGQISYIATSLARDPTGESLDLSPLKLTQEGLDRGGVFGVLMEPVNIFSKWGWLPWNSPSRYNNVGIAGVLIGPTLGRAIDTGFDIGKMAQAAYGNREYSSQDAKAIMRMIPYQNLFYLRYINEQVFLKLAESLGAAEKD